MESVEAVKSKYVQYSAFYLSRLLMGRLCWTAHSPRARMLPDTRTSSFGDTPGTCTSNNACCDIVSAGTI